MQKTFLSLPAELRQRILYSSFNTTYKITLRPIPEDEDQDDFINRYGPLYDALQKWEAELRHCRTVVENFMRVCKDSRMKDDVRYIAHQRIEELVPLLHEMIKENKFDERDFEGTLENTTERAALTMMKISKAVGRRLNLRKKN
ncbi:hypothetical protein Vi05172_g11152 [Venturia inaequalis]|nr:hypothetical protein Vi05172_g11152 [Venturia inaequalis]